MAEEPQAGAIKFSNEDKLRQQMARRGWTEQMIVDAVYVPLLNEDVDVWRPVDAQKVGPNTYFLPTDSDPAAQAETRAFPPGSTVVCQPRKTADGTILAAVRLAGRGRKAV